MINKSDNFINLYWTLRATCTEKQYIFVWYVFDGINVFGANYKLEHKTCNSYRWKRCCQNNSTFTGVEQDSKQMNTK